MRGHIVRAFLIMDETAIAIRRNIAHESFQIRSDTGVGILTKDQRCTSVLNKDVAQASAHTGCRNQRFDLAGYFNGLALTGSDINAAFINQRLFLPAGRYHVG